MASVTIEHRPTRGRHRHQLPALGEAHASRSIGLAQRWCCQRCHHEQKARWNSPARHAVLRDLTSGVKPSFWSRLRHPVYDRLTDGTSPSPCSCAALVCPLALARVFGRGRCTGIGWK